MIQYPKSTTLGLVALLVVSGIALAQDVQDPAEAPLPPGLSVDQLDAMVGTGIPQDIIPLDAAGEPDDEIYVPEQEPEGAMGLDQNQISAEELGGLDPSYTPEPMDLFLPLSVGQVATLYGYTPVPMDLFLRLSEGQVAILKEKFCSQQ